METFGQVGCSVRRPARSGWAQARWVGFHPLFRGGRCNRGVVPLPIRFTARKDGDLRSGCLLGQETTHPFHGGHRRHDQDGGDLRSGRVLGQETGTIIFVSVRAQPARSWWNRGVGLGSTPSLEGDGVTGGWCRYPSVSRPGKMETFGQVGCTTGADGDLRSGRVLGEDAGTIRMVETFGQIACSVRRPARSYLFRYGHSRSSEVEPGGWVGFHPLFRGGRCNRGVVP